MKWRFTEHQIIGFLREAHAGMPTGASHGQHGLADASHCARKAGFVVMKAVAAAWFALAAAMAGAAPAVHQVPDTSQQRLLACTGCHGKDGRATNQGYFPRIAGKPAGYIYNQLVNFRTGRRNNAGMANMVEYMSDAYLWQIAEHFAALDLPYPRPQTANAPPALLAEGERLVTQGDSQRGLPACTQCHGAAMTGRLPAIPGLLGLPRDYVVGQLGAWKTGLRKAVAPDCMAQIAQALTANDIAAVSTWLSSQAIPGQARPAAASAAPLPLRCGAVIQ